MSSFNKITIVGYLGKDPELRYTPQGDAVCNISVATTERRKDAAGEPRDFTTWFRITLWRRQAELCAEYFHKGSQIYIEGRLRQDEYTDRDGNKRQSLVVTATDMQFIGPRGDGRPDESHYREEQPARQRSGKEPAPRPEDDEIPF
jgi:single-strand DNA-binding protein